jgi:hypothetical protein
VSAFWVLPPSCEATWVIPGGGSPVFPTIKKPAAWLAFFDVGVDVGIESLGSDGKRARNAL